jgi:hypothetical protein
MTKQPKHQWTLYSSHHNQDWNRFVCRRCKRSNWELREKTFSSCDGASKQSKNNEMQCAYSTGCREPRVEGRSRCPKHLEYCNSKRRQAWAERNNKKNMKRKRISSSSPGDYPANSDNEARKQARHVPDSAGHSAHQSDDARSHNDGRYFSEKPFSARSGSHSEPHSDPGPSSESESSCESESSYDMIINGRVIRF